MSRYGIPIHKLGWTKPVVTKRVRTQPDSVHCLTKKVTPPPVRQQGGLRWEIYTQKNKMIQTRGTIALKLGLGVRMTRGMCLISLRLKIKEKWCSLQVWIVSEDVEDIMITIQNNSDSNVILKVGDSLRYVIYYAN